MIHNMVGGAGVMLPGIFVTYPSGSTCTCTNGTTTYTAKGTSGFWFFSGLAVGTWTVKATKGTDSASQSVEITSATQGVSVRLSYGLIIFENGYDNTAVTGGYNISNNATSTSYTSFEIGEKIVLTSKPYSGANVVSMAQSVNLINVSEYSKLHLVGKYLYAAATASRQWVGLAQANTPVNSLTGVAYKQLGAGAFDVEIDISAVQSGYLTYRVDANTPSIGNTLELNTVEFLK